MAGVIDDVGGELIALIGAMKEGPLRRWLRVVVRFARDSVQTQWAAEARRLIPHRRTHSCPLRRLARQAHRSHLLIEPHPQALDVREIPRGRLGDLPPLKPVCSRYGG